MCDIQKRIFIWKRILYNFKAITIQGQNNQIILLPKMYNVLIARKD